MIKLFIIGNGFDLAHKMPTRFDPDFKEIAEKNEPIRYFWELYSGGSEEIWSDFENLLAYPDFNLLSEIFDSYYPDYLSDRESDRDGIIYQVELNGNLATSLQEFACQADDSLCDVVANHKFLQMFTSNSLYINFNYTHTLEEIYQISSHNILHIHGEVGGGNLILGYPAGIFSPSKIEVDPRGKGRGPYRYEEVEDYINGIEDYYVRTAYTGLFDKVKSFEKTPRITEMLNFVGKSNITEIIVYGHSCAVDFEYFNKLNQVFPNANWEFHSFDEQTRNNIESLVSTYGIKNYKII